MKTSLFLLADSGSTKTDWCVVQDGNILQRIPTRGTNPFFQTEAEIEAEIVSALLPELSQTSFDAVFFYGAGCAFADKIGVVQRAISRHLAVKNEISVHSDMLAAARGLCGTKAGIACILGTGSNTCFYDGKEIAANVSPLGYILGDEGSGAYLGKRLVGDLLKNQMREGLKEIFLQEYDLQPSDIIERVYRRPFPNRFLASLSPFILKHIDEPCVRDMVTDSFRAFFTRNVMQYDYRRYPVHFIGSVAYHYRAILCDVASELGIDIGTIAQSPMEGLIAYHTNTNIP